jgi:hypothetical protein
MNAGNFRRASNKALEAERRGVYLQVSPDIKAGYTRFAPCLPQES